MKKIKILVVEDEGIVALDIKNRLEQMDYEVNAVVDNGADAIKASYTNPPDLVLMDIQIKGDIDGIETAERIRTFVDIPIIYLTANADGATLQRAKSSTPLAYLIKPFDERELHTTIEIGLYRHKLETKLKKHQEQWSKTLLSIGDGVITTDDKGCIVFMNPVAEKITGWKHDYAIGKPIQQILTLKNEITGETVINPVLKVLETNSTVFMANHTELHNQNGKVIPVEDSAAPINDSIGKITGVVLIFRDITERRCKEIELEKYRDKLEILVDERTKDLKKKTELLLQEIHQREESEKREVKLQDELNRAERMKSVALLAGGVAHDLNNMLGPLIAYPDLILEKTPGDSPIREKLKRMKKSAKNAAAIVQDLLTLARRGRYEMEVLDLNEFTRDYLNSVDFLMTLENYPNVKLTTEFHKGKTNIMGSVPHLTKVIMNLCKNALEATSGSGILNISTKLGPIERVNESVKEDMSGEYISLHVKDTGKGISEEDIKFIFEPYYSNKKMGKSGSGLGLSVVYGVLKDHNGYYDVVSEIGKGTEFILYFPVTSAKRQNKEIESNVDQNSSGRILVVDDYEEQRDLASDVLESLGYKVDTVENGHRAVDFLKENDVDLVLLDMIMEPGFDGYDTLKAIKEFKSDQKAVIMSGFTVSDRVMKMQALGAKQYIRKPYTKEQISEAVRIEIAN